MNLNSLTSIVLCALSLITFSSLAQRVAGGAPKPGASFGYENISAIATSEQVQTVLAESFGDRPIQINKLELTNVDSTGFHYRLETSSSENRQCVMDVTVWNTHSALVKDVKVTALKIVSGCESQEAAQLTPLQELIAITRAPSVMGFLRLSFSVEKIELKKVSEEGKLYALTADTITPTTVCQLEVLVKAGVVVHATNLSGDAVCKIIEKPRPVSVLTKYKDIFEKFPKRGWDDQASYEEYLEIARSISPELRNEIREYMKTSEPKFYQVLSDNQQVLKDFFAKVKPAKFGNALYILYKIMGVPTDTQGIYMPAIVALSFAPFFVVD